MTDALWKVIVLCLIGALLATFLKKTSPDISLLLAGCVCLAVLSTVIRGFGEIWKFLVEIMERGGLGVDLFSPLIKLIGIALLSRTVGELCRDAGQSALSGIVETAGVFASILVSLPLFRAAWELLEGLL